MKGKKTIWFVMAIGASCLMGARFFQGPFEVVKNIEIFLSLYQEISQHYVDTLDSEQLIGKGIRGALGQVEDAEYFPAGEVNTFHFQNAKHSGVGFLLGTYDSAVYVTDIYPGSPAEKKGLKIGDRIIQINKKSVERLPLAELLQRLQDEAFSPITLVVRRAEGDISFSIEQVFTSPPCVGVAEIIGNSIGYIGLTNNLQSGTARELRKTLERLKLNGARAILLDLRGNTADGLYEAVNVANVFLPKNTPIVVTKKKDEAQNKSFSTLDEPWNATMPLAVLINAQTASAAEIIVGSYQDYDRAVLIGEKTAGKGFEQTLFPLPHQSLLRLPVARYYTPIGRGIEAQRSGKNMNSAAFQTKNKRIVYEKGGIEPDIALPKEEGQLAISSLLREGAIFLYANLYCAQHSEPTDLRSFSDKNYVEFTQWLQQRKRKPSPLAELSQNLIKTAKRDSLSKTLQEAIIHLEQSLPRAQADVLSQHQNAIKKLLISEINRRYASATERLQIDLRQDAALLRGIEILSDSAQYEKYLLP